MRKSQPVTETSTKMTTGPVQPGADLRPETHGTIIFWALIASLTRFIPLPLVDDLLESGLEKMMFKQMAEAYEITLSESELDVLSCDTTDFSGVKVALRSGARLVGRFFLKALLIFELKDAADTFSAVYHLGVLLDYAFKTRKLERFSAAQLRVAIDTVCRKTGTSPVNRVFMGIMKESLSLLGSIKDFIIKTVSEKGDEAPSPAHLEKDAPPEAEELVAKLEKELDQMPPGYFQALRENLEAALEKMTASDE